MQCAPLDHSHSHVNTGQRQRRCCAHAVALQLGMALQQTVGTVPLIGIQASTRKQKGGVGSECEGCTERVSRQGQAYCLRHGDPL